MSTDEVVPPRGRAVRPCHAAILPARLEIR